MPDTFLVTINGEEYEVDANSPEEAQALATRAAGAPAKAPESLDPGNDPDQLGNLASGLWKGVKSVGTGIVQGANKLTSEIDLGGRPLVDYNPDMYAAARAELGP